MSTVSRPSPPCRQSGIFGSPVPVVFCWRSSEHVDPSHSTRRCGWDARGRATAPRMAPMMEDQGLERTVDRRVTPSPAEPSARGAASSSTTRGVVYRALLAPAVNDALSNLWARGDAFFCTKSHTVFLLSPIPDPYSEHLRNREARRPYDPRRRSDDPRSPLRALYDSPTFRDHALVTGANGALHLHKDCSPASTSTSSAGQELGWHDNSSFAHCRRAQASV